MPKALTRQQKKANKDQNRVRLLTFLLEHPCADCGEADPVVLDLHHLHTESKSADVSSMVAKGLPWSLIRKELEQCQSKCANCHRRFHALGERSWRILAMLPGGADDYYRRDWAEAFAVVQCHIERLEAQEPRWVRARHQLPEVNREVLVFSVEVDEYEMVDIGFWTGTEWQWRANGKPVEGRLIYWMPLPPFPKWGYFDVL